MHATIHQLLSVRDAEPVETSVAQHVDECASCRRELQRLSSLRRQLQELAQIDAPPSAWLQIRQRSQQRSSAAVRRLAMIASAAALASLAVIAGVVLRDGRSPPEPRTAGEPSLAPTSADAAADVAALVAQSQELEQLLHALPGRPAVERVSTAATIDVLEQRIEWLDYHLSYAPQEVLSDQQSQRLWRERVELMDSLVKVRYAEAQRVSF